MKKYKSKRAEATDIPQEVKQRVYERDKGLCVICGRPGIPNAHYIRRSQGGLGVEQNVVTLCPECHFKFDNGFYREQIGIAIREYLKHYYGFSWNEKNLYYDKWRYSKDNK